MSIAPTSPASIFVGQWSQIKDALIAAAGSTYGVAGQNGGKKSLETKNVPQHTHNTKAGNSAATTFYNWGGFWKTNAAGGSLWQLLSFGGTNETDTWLYATDLTGGGIKHCPTLCSLQLLRKRLDTHFLNFAKEVCAKWLR